MFLQYFSNKNGNIVLMQHIPHWPNDMLATLLFEEADGKITITFLWKPRNPTAEETVAFEAKRADHVKGCRHVTTA
jgi:hypothetical protein